MRPFNKILISLLILALFINHAKSARAETVINNCTVLGAAGETYSLANDIFNSNNMSCMRANADNVTLDCGGHVIDSMYINGASGVYAESVKNFTVRNCSLAEWWYGIQFASTTASIVENVNSSYNYWGVYLFGGGANNITRSLFSWNSRDGIWAASASANVIENSTIRQNSYNGIYLSSSSLNNMTGLSVYSNGLSGINISSSSNNTVSLSSIYSNAKNGIFIGASSEGNKAENTTLRLNSVSGVYLQRDRKSVV